MKKIPKQLKKYEITLWRIMGLSSSKINKTKKS